MSYEMKLLQAMEAMRIRNVAVDNEVGIGEPRKGILCENMKI